MRTRKTAERRRSEIVDATLRLAGRLGPDRVSTEAVAAAVGLTQPGLFRHFPKKQALWAAVAARIGETMEAAWSESQRRDAPPPDRLLALLMAQLRLIQATPAIPAILFSHELHTRNRGLRQAFFGLLRRFHAALSERVGQAQASGALRGDVERDDLAFLLLGQVQGLAVRWSISGREFDLVEEGGRLLEILLQGFAAPSAGPRRRVRS